MFGRNKNSSEKRGEVNFGEPAQMQAAGQAPASTQERLPDDLNRHRTGDLVKGNNKVVRTLSFVSIGSIMTIVILVSIIATMAPLRRDVPWVVVVDSAGDVDVTQAVWRMGNSKELTVNEINTTQFLRYYFQVTSDFRQMGRVWQNSCVDQLVSGDNFADELCAYLPARMSEPMHEEFIAANLSEVTAMVNARQTRELTLLREPLLMDTYEEAGQNVYLWEYQIRLSDFDNRGKAGPQAISSKATGLQGAGNGQSEAYFTQKLAVRIWTTFNARYRPSWAQRYQNPLNFRMLKIEVAKLADGEEQ